MAVDSSMKQAPIQVDGQLTLVARRRDEAYAEVNNSDDEVFHTDLYDWYRSQGLMDRLLEIQSPYIISYLRRISEENAAQADLLWRYFVQGDRFYDAAGVQFDLAKSDFDMPLEKRIEYLSRARANASTQTAGVGRQPRQLLIHDVSDRLDVANIQDDLLQRQLSDDRHTPESRKIAVKRLNGKVLGLTDVR
jgi:nuclear pore complex protein Nup155